MNKDNKSYSLNKIYNDLVNVSNAIVSVINVDLTIVDSSLRRIYATGEYVNSIGNKVADNVVFAYALETGEKFIIENPREHMACIKCKKRKSCIEYAQVCCPITIDNQIIGIIGLVAFNEEQRNIILKNKENLLEFLSRMSDLLAVKLIEKNKTEEISLIAKELEILVNSFDTSIISSDVEGNVIRFNSLANKYFGLSYYDNVNINKIINVNLNDIKEKKRAIKNKELDYKSDNFKFRGYYNISPIIIENEVIGFVFTFSKMREIIEVVNDVVGTNMITDFDDIIGESPIIDTVKDYAKRISKGNSTVLIQGESGTGKELFARAIHYNSNRKKKPFIAINCAAIPENLIESELFGYDEGAFTGARKGGKIGKFELANKGTLFLDEIGDMPLHMQTKLLRVLQENEVERICGNRLIPIDVRIIAASNKPLENMVNEGEFREDLFYRLNVIPINLPSLRERKDDIPVITNEFIDKYNYKLDRNVNKVNDNVLSLFENYNWPGNVRELENVIEYAINMSNDYEIKIDDLPKRLKNNSQNIKNNDNFIIPIKELEKREMVKALNKYGRSNEGIAKACNDLKISRATIYRKIKQYNI